MVEQISIPTRLPVTLVEEADLLVKEGIFSNRSEIIRSAMRYYLAEQVKLLQPSRFYFEALGRAIKGKVKPKTEEQLVKELRKMRESEWRKRKTF